MIKITSKSNTATLWLNHPPLNVLTIPMLEEMIHAIQELQSDKELRLLIVRGEGKCFSAGMDVADHLPQRVHLMFEKTHQMMHKLAHLNLPVISLIHGCALGGGLELAAVSDFIYAVDGCKIGLPEIKLGVFPPFAVAYFSEWIGPRNANDLILTGRTILPEEAKAMGMVMEVFSEKDCEIRLEEAANQLISFSKAAFAATKKALRSESVWERLKEVEQIYLNELMKSEDATEGLKAFLEKRSPKWK